MGSVFVFTRVLEDDSENQYSQGATVYATSSDEAQGILRATLQQLRESEGERGRRDEQSPAYEEAPPWIVEEIGLEQPKLLTMVVQSASAYGS